MTAVLLLPILLVSPGATEFEGLSLEAAQAEARLHAPEIGEIEARLAGESAIAADARRVVRDDPTFGARLERGSGHEASSEFSIAFPVDVSGSFLPRRRSARARLEAALLSKEDALRALDESVAIAVADLAHAQRAASRSKRISALYRVAADAARRERQVGKGNALDSDAADLDYAIARSADAGAERALTEARARLARLLGRPSADGLLVPDPEESTTAPSVPDLETLIAEDPGVRAAAADAESSRLQVAMEDRRRLRPFEAEIGRLDGTRKIPADAFTGPGESGARWSDSATSVRLGIPIPLFDRNREARVTARAVRLEADARVLRIRADVRAEIQVAWSRLRSASRAAEAFAGSEETIERDLDLLDKAFQAGAMDSVARAQALRRIEAAAEARDAALHELRVARAVWTRRSGSAP